MLIFLLLALHPLDIEAANTDPKLVLEPASNSSSFFSLNNWKGFIKWWKSLPSKNLDLDLIEFHVETSEGLKKSISVSFLKKGLSVSTWTELYFLV